MGLAEHNPPNGGNGGGGGGQSLQRSQAALESCRAQSCQQWGGGDKSPCKSSVKQIVLCRIQGRLGAFASFTKQVSLANEGVGKSSTVMLPVSPKFNGLSPG